MADMLVQKELALSMAYVAVQALDETDPARRRRMLSAAKVTLARAAATSASRPFSCMAAWA